MSRRALTALGAAVLGALVATASAWLAVRALADDQFRSRQRVVERLAHELGSGPLERRFALDPARAERRLDPLRRLWPDATLALVEATEPPSALAAQVPSADHRWWLDASFPPPAGLGDGRLAGLALAGFLLAGGVAWCLPLRAERGPPADPEELEELDELRAEVARLRERGREWVSNAAHDLRTPLAILRGSLETLCLPEGRLDADQRRRYLESALEQSDRLGRLVQDLFDLTRFEGQSTIRAERFLLGELIQDCVQLYRVRAEERGVMLATELDAGSTPVDADVALVERALRNLVDNALRHTDPGGRVTVRLRRAPGRVHVEVEDTGCGIAAEDLPHIFDRFYRSRGLSTTGAGLGLAITQRIVDLHGGRLRVDSRVGVGSRFSFDLAIAMRAREPLDSEM